MWLDRRGFVKAGTTLAGSLVIDFGVPLGCAPDARGRRDRTVRAECVHPHRRWHQAPFNACVSRADDYAGPPVILQIAYHERTLALQEDIGGRVLLSQPALPCPKEVINPHASFDLDCSGDVRMASAWAERRSA